MSIEAADRSKEVVERALNALGDIATLPQVTVKIINIVENPKSTARDLHEVIKTDPALSAKLLKVVNSAFYGLPGQVANIDRAIVLLGLAAVKNIAVAASISRFFKGKTVSPNFSPTDLWRHSVAVGVAARNIARVSKKHGIPDELFVAGLIHDLGILVERQAFPDQFNDVVERAAATGDNFLTCEREIIGADHQAFGNGLTTKWKFPKHLRAAVGFHHNPEALSEELLPFGTVIYAADILCCEANLGFSLSARNGVVNEATLEVLGISAADLDKVRAELPEALAEAEKVLAS